jgi:hypothetical protein
MMRILAFFLLLTAPMFGGEHLYALLACDTLSNLRSEVAINKNRLLKLLDAISLQTGLDLRTTVIEGKDLTEGAFYAWMEQVRQDPDGVVLFSYSGHGHRTESSAEAVPYLCFSKSPADFKTDVFYHKLESSGQRLTIVLLDCCNVFKTEHSLKKSIFPAPKNLPGMKALFLENRGTIVLMGAIPGESSWYYYGQGGLFTSSLIQSLFEEAQRENASWQCLFDRTSQLCKRRQQHPFSLLNISCSDSCKREDAS